MSLRSLQLGLESLRDEERALDGREKRCEKARRATTPDAEKVATDLYKRIVNVVVGKQELRVGLTQQPPYGDDVIKLVTEMFKVRGWKAKHVYNDGYNFYDWLEIKPTAEAFINFKPGDKR